MMMMGKQLVEVLSGMEGVQCTQMGQMAGGKLKFEICDVVVASGEGEDTVVIDGESVLTMIRLLDDAPDLKDVYDEDSFRRLAEMAIE